MRLVSVSLKESEVKALKKICKVRNISSRHHAIKIAIEEYIERFEQNALHHRVPDSKLVECPSNK
jgi:metal-responsive CopG/Arc/MetJ family transcriptional regulator